MKRIISYLLLSAMLVSAASCGSGGGSDETSGGDTASDETTVDPNAPPFEKDDYSGEKFHILAPDSGLYPLYFFADETNGDAMNDAIYNRELLVEDYLGIDITHSVEGGSSSGGIDLIAGKVEKTVMSGDDAYQLVLTHCMKCVPEMLMGDLLYAWNDFTYVDLDREYWNQSCNESLTLFGKLYYAVSDYMIADPNGILFNKGMLEDFKLENPYELVRSGDWTIDKMTEMASNVTSDINGDSVLDINDRYGLACDDDWRWNSFNYAAGIKMIETDKDGNMNLTINSPRMVTLVEKIDYLVNKSDISFIWRFGSTEDKWLTIASDRVLFQPESLRELYRYRDSDVDYGIVPYPKLEASQENYETNNWSGLMCVPKSVGNPEMVGKACELLAFFSGNTTVPAYYDVLLGAKLARDADSREMLELIFDNIVYDPGFNFLGLSSSMNKLFYTLGYNIVRQGNDNFASWYAQHETVAKGQIDDLIAAVKANG